MAEPFFDHPILNSPYEYPKKHWELDEAGQPTQKVIEQRRRARFITPIPKPKKRKAAAQKGFVFDEGKRLSTKEQQYDPTSVINEVRGYVDTWRALPNPNQWQVTPETARLLKHWRSSDFGGVRPFFCQVEAAETAIWLTEVAPQSTNGKRLLDHLAAANKDANPELMRLALKLATGAGKTTVMAMIIAWQTINAVRRPGSKNFTRGFLICAPGLTIKDRLRVLQPNDPDSYYASRELVPGDMLDDVKSLCRPFCSVVVPSGFFRRGFAQIGLSQEFAAGSIGVFMHRGDSPGECGSNVYFLANKKSNYEPCGSLFTKLGARLKDRALIISDGSNTSIGFLRRFHSNRTTTCRDAFSFYQGRVFEFGGFTWACVGWLGRRYGPTLVWGVTRQTNSPAGLDNS